MHSNRPLTGPPPRDRRRAALLHFLPGLLLISSGAVTGCMPNKRYDLIEAELRTREKELTETRAALEQARNLNRAYAQQALTADAPGPVPTTPTYVPVKDITLGRGTGPIPGELARGEDALMVVVVPRDEDGAAVKVPARVDVAAWEFTEAGLKNPIGSWTLPPEKVRPTWRSGFISTGYFVQVPWQTRPSSEKVRVAVRLTTLDGRLFETDRDITVKPGGGPRVSPPTVTPTPNPGLGRQREPLFPDPIPPGTEELPPPSMAPDRGGKLLRPE